MMGILGRNAITTDRVRAIVTLFITLAALLAMPTAGGFAGMSDSSHGGRAFDSSTCSGSVAVE